MDHQPVPTVPLGASVRGIVARPVHEPAQLPVELGQSPGVGGVEHHLAEDGEAGARRPMAVVRLWFHVVPGYSPVAPRHHQPIELSSPDVGLPPTSVRSTDGRS